MGTLNEVRQKQAVIYTRVSSDKQVDGYSLDSQKDLCEQKAKQMGYVVVRTFREEGISATTTNRPELQDLLTYCRNKQNAIDAVFVYSFSRLNRNTIDFLTLRHLLSKSGITLESCTEPTGESPEHQLIETILASMAEYENKSRARNVANSLRKRFMEGNITSRPALGYIMQKVNGKSTAVKDPDTFDILKNLWQRVLREKLSLSDVARELNRLGVKSKFSVNFTKFTPQSVSNIFSNKFFMGTLVSKKYGEIQGQHEPMVDEDVFYQVRAIITGRKPHGKTRYALREDFALRGILNCEYCDRKASGAWSKGKNKRYAYYCCSARKVHKVVSHPVGILDDKFLELLQTIKPTKKFMLFFSAILKEKYHARFAQLTMAQDKILKDIDVLKKTKKTLSEKHLAGIYSDEDYLEMKEEIVSEIAIKNGLLNEKKMDKIDIETVLEFMVYYLTHLDKIFLKASPQLRLKIGCSLLPFGIVFENGSYRTPLLGRGYKLTNEFYTTPIKLGESAGIRTQNQ